MMDQITHKTQSFQWHIHHFRLQEQCSVGGKLSQNPSAIDFYQGQEGGFKELIIPYKTCWKYELC